MEKMFGEWYRTVHLEPTGEILKARWSGIEAFVEQAKREDILDLAGLFHQHGPTCVTFVDKFREFFFAVDNAFLMRGNDAELAVLAGVALLRLAQVEDEPMASCAALAAICPSLQRKRCGEIVPDIGDCAREYLSRQSAGLRAASKESVDNVSYRQILKDIEKVTGACTKNSAAELGAPLTASLTQLDAGVSYGIGAFRGLHQRMLLLEEASDILWWMNGAFSRDLEKPLSSLRFSVVCVLAGKELADLVRVLPGPYAARAILYSVLEKANTKQEKCLTLTDAVHALEDNWRKKWTASAGRLSATPLCPLLSAAGQVTHQGQTEGRTDLANTVSDLDPKAELSPLDVAYQAYQESLFVRAFQMISGDNDA